MQVEEVNALCEHIAELRAEKDRLAKEKATIEESLDNAQQELVATLMELDKTNWEVKGIGKFSVAASNYYKVTDPEKVRQYFIVKRPELQGMVSVNANTLRAWANNEPNLNYDEIGITPDFRSTIRFSKA